MEASLFNYAKEKHVVTLRMRQGRWKGRKLSSKDRTWVVSLGLPQARSVTLGRSLDFASASVSLFAKRR